MYKKWILIFALVLMGIFFQACSANKNKNENVTIKPTEESKKISKTDTITSINIDKKDNNSEEDSQVSNTDNKTHHEVTLEEIKNKYQPGEILDIKTYNDNYILIESRQIPDPTGNIAYDPTNKYVF